jgi:opacity protein-like surface antigen
MKPRAFSLVLLLTASTIAGAQRPLTLNLGGGVSVPVGSFADGAEPGWHAIAGLGLGSLMQPIGLRLDVAYNAFTAKVAGPDASVASGTLNLSYRLPVTNSAFSPYVIVGAGAYRLDCNDPACEATTKFGWNGGLGTKAAVFGAKWFLEARYQSVRTPGSLRFVTATLGLTI